MFNFIKESVIEEQPIPVDIEGTKLILFQMENCICKIIKDNGTKGTGFFCQIPFPDKNNLLNVLITNNHILNEKDIENNKIIKIIMYNQNQKIEKRIKIDDSRKKYTNINDDITIIEIKSNKDDIYNFLEIEDEILELEYKRKSIYILHHPENKQLVSYGLIDDIIEGKEINHYCNTKHGSSGSPILSLESFKVIGVHKWGSNKSDIKINYGTFIKFIINEFNNKYKSEKRNKISEFKIEKSKSKEKIRFKAYSNFGNIITDKNKNECERFKNDLKSNLSKVYSRVQVIFQSDEFNNLNEKEFLDKFKNDEDFEELKNLKEIHTDVIMSGCKLNKNQLDSRGNKIEGWSIGEMRGNKLYYPPLGWIGIGLKVMNKYEDDIWIGRENIEGEWCVAYHGVGRDRESDEVKKITGNIYKTRFKPGSGQYHENCDDIFHPGMKIGRGVYCFPRIEVAEIYAGISEINGKKYKTVLMNRVKPDAIRQCKCTKDKVDYWVINGTPDEIRPYRILYKNIDFYKKVII